MTALQAWVTVEGYDVREVVRRTPTTDAFLTYHRPTGTYRELLVVERVPDVDQGALRTTIEAEVAAARAVTHLGIAPVEEIGLTRDGRVYVASARPVGRSLPTLLAEDGRLAVLRAFELGHTLVTALAVAHERGIVHGWLTPDSVIVLPSRAGLPERAVVLGLGTAAAQDAGLMVGAFSEQQSHYMSPERAAGEPPSTRGDVFALGSLLLSMLTASTPSVVRAAGISGSATADDSWAPGDIEQVLHRARSADPAARYASASELGTALWMVHNAWFAARHDAQAPDARTTPAPGLLAQRRAFVAAGVVGMLAAGATARLWAGHGAADLEGPLAATSHAPHAPAAAAPATPPSVAVAPTPLQAGDSTAAVADLDRAARERIAAATALVPAGATPAAAVPDAAAPAAAAIARSPSADSRGPGRVPGAVASASPATAGARAVGTSAVGTNAVGTTVAAAPTTVTTTSGGDIAAANASAPRPIAAGATAPVATPSSPAAPDAGASDAARGARASEVLAKVAEYGTAIGARDLDQLARLYPAMTDQQRRGWKAFFGSVTDLRAPLTVEQIAVAGATAQVRVRAAYEYENLRPHRAERSVVQYKLTLVRDTAGWRIRAVE